MAAQLQVEQEYIDGRHKLTIRCPLTPRCAYLRLVGKRGDRRALIKAVEEWHQRQHGGES